MRLKGRGGGSGPHAWMPTVLFEAGNRELGLMERVACSRRPPISFRGLWPSPLLPLDLQSLQQGLSTVLSGQVSSLLTVGSLGGLHANLGLDLCSLYFTGHNPFTCNWLSQLCWTLLFPNESHKLLWDYVIFNFLIIMLMVSQQRRWILQITSWIR